MHKNSWSHSPLNCITLQDVVFIAPFCPSWTCDRYGHRFAVCKQCFISNFLILTVLWLELPSGWQINVLLFNYSRCDSAEIECKANKAQMGLFNRVTAINRWGTYLWMLTQVKFFTPPINKKKWIKLGNSHTTWKNPTYGISWRGNQGPILNFSKCCCWI